MLLTRRFVENSCKFNCNAQGAYIKRAFDFRLCQVYSQLEGCGVVRDRYGAYVAVEYKSTNMNKRST